jgi:hypothetical protein
MVKGQIWQRNLEAFLTTLGWIVCYSVDKDDLDMINNDLLDGGGGELKFDGATVSVSINSDTSLLDIAVNTTSDLEPQVELALTIFQHFELRKLPAARN